jgi:hypothetical protein
MEVKMNNNKTLYFYLQLVATFYSKEKLPKWASKSVELPAISHLTSYVVTRGIIELTFGKLIVHYYPTGVWYGYIEDLGIRTMNKKAWFTRLAMNEYVRTRRNKNGYR